MGPEIALLAIAASASLASGGMAVASGIAQQKQAEQAAKGEEEAARMEAMLKKNQLSQIQSTIRANVAAMGADVNTGSAYALQQSNKRMADIDIGLAAKARSQSAFRLRSQGAAAFSSGIMSAVGSLADAAKYGAEAYSLATKPKPLVGPVK